MSSLNEVVTVVNRTSKMLHGTFNGKPYDIPPGESRYSRQEASYFKFQNPVMGRGTPLEDWNSKSEYLIGIKEDGDDVTSIEQTNAPQRWDTEMVNGSNISIVRPRGGGYMPEVRQPLRSNLQDSGFSKD